MDQTTQQNAALVEEMAAAASNLKDQAQQLVHAVYVFKQDTSSSRGTAVGSSLAGAAPLAGAGGSSGIGINLDEAIKAHANWKNKLRAAISRQEQLDVDTVSRDDCCEMGKWLHGGGKAKFGSRPRFVELLQAHRGFHQEAGKVARKVNQGAYEEADKMLNSDTGYSRASHKVTQLIVQFGREIGAGGTKVAKTLTHALPVRAQARPAPAPQPKAPAADEGEWETF